MTKQRWASLMQDPLARLTPAEMAEGWHWCMDFDQLLVGPEMAMEWECCTCFGDNKEKFDGSSQQPQDTIFDERQHL